MTRKGVVVRAGGCLFVDVDVAWVDSLADASETVGLDDVVFLLDLSVLVEWCIREPIVPTKLYY